MGFVSDSRVMGFPISSATIEVFGGLIQTAVEGGGLMLRAAGKIAAVLPALVFFTIQGTSANAQWQLKASSASDPYSFVPAMLCGRKPSSEVEAGAILEQLGLKRTSTGWSFRDSTGLTTVYGRAENRVMFVEFVPARRSVLSQPIMSLLAEKAEKVEMRTPTEFGFRFPTDLDGCGEFQTVKVSMPAGVWIATLCVVNWQ